MKKKLVTIVLLSLMITTVIFGTAGSALAEEINFTIMSYQSEDFSEDEIDFALSNLQYKLEDEELPRLIRVEELYDFNEEPLYGLYEFDNYHMIVVRETGSVLERGEGNSAYFGNNKGTKYYGGNKEYYVSFDNGYKNLLTDEVVNQSQVSQMQSRMEELRQLDYQDYLEAMATPMPLDSKNRIRATKLGKDIASLIEQLFGNKDYLYYYFEREINIDYQHNYYNAFYFKDNNGYNYYRYFDDNYGYDLFYPRNEDDECSLVAMTILLQYYYRTTINEKLIDPFYNHPYKDYTDIINNPLSSLTETIKLNLQTHLNTITPSTNAASYVNMDAAFDKYFKANNIDCESIHFTSYTNVKGAINAGHPSIFNTGTGTGYDKNNDKVDVSLHNLIAYGYTTNSIGVLDEFICHACWHRRKGVENTNAECAKLYVNKFHAAGNLHLSY